MYRRCKGSVSEVVTKRFKYSESLKYIIITNSKLITTTTIVNILFLWRVLGGGNIGLTAAMLTCWR